MGDDGRVEETESVRTERCIEEIDGLVRSMRSEGYDPEDARRMADLIREHDDLIRRLFEMEAEKI